MNLQQQDWSRLKPGAENSAWVSVMSGTHLVELLPVVCQGVHEQEAGIRSRDRT